jgi:signal transduction histidine kinase
VNPDPTRRGAALRIGLNLLGLAVVGIFLGHDIAPSQAAWVTWLAVGSLVCWAAIVFVPRRSFAIDFTITLGMVALAALTAVPSNGLTIAVVAVGILHTLSGHMRPLWPGVVIAGLAAGLVPVGGFLSPITPLGVVSLEAGVVVVFFAGISRRQYRAAEAQSRLLLEERLAAREEQARTAVLAERQAVARDIHDVLAHGLGGLVIQLDAVEALLEAGRTTDATARVHDAHALALSGLAEARRAVDALRDERDDPSVPGDEVTRSLGDLAQAHRALGGSIRFDAEGTPHPVSADEAHALRRAMQESLTNARKHAPGEPVTAELRWSPGSVELEIANPVATAETSPGTSAATALTLASGGHGLTGMAERFDALGEGRVSAGERDGRFVVSARVGAP